MLRYSNVTKMSTLFQSDFFTTYKNVFFNLVVGVGNMYLHYYHAKAFNINLSVRVVRYPYNNMCF